MPDVRLPNGELIRNVPPGMSKADLVAKLRANGHDMSWVDGPDQPAVAPAEEALVDDTVRMIGGKGGGRAIKQSELTGAMDDLANIPKLVGRSAARLGEGLTELPAAVARLPGQVVGSVADLPETVWEGITGDSPLVRDIKAMNNPDAPRAPDRETYAGKLGKVTGDLAAPVTGSHPVQATREWFQDKEAQAVAALTPAARRAIELSLVESDEDGLHAGEGATDPWWWTANVIDVGVQAAPGMGATAVAARMGYAAKYRAVLGELSAQKIPQSVAIKAAEKQAMQAASRAAVISGGLTEGAIGGGQDASEVRATVESLDEETLMGYPGYLELREAGMTHEQARERVAADKAAATAISAGAVIGLTGAPMNAFFGRLTAKLGRESAQEAGTLAARAGKVGEAALGEGVQEFGQEGAEQVIQNQQLAPITKAGTWDNVLENAITGGVLGAVVGAGAASPALKGPKKAPKADEPAPTTPAPPDAVGGAASAYETATAALRAGMETAKDPNVRMKYADLRALKEAHQKAMVDYTRELMHAGMIKEADQANVAAALKQAEAAGISATASKPAGGDISPARDAALEGVANAEMIDETDANDLITNKLAKVGPAGNMILTPEGRRQRKAAQERAKKEAESGQDKAQPAKKPAKTAQVKPAKLVLPAEKRAIAQKNAGQRAIRKTRPAKELAAAKAAEATREADVLKATIQAKDQEHTQNGNDRTQIGSAFQSALDRARRARAGLPNRANAAFRLKGQPETAEIPGQGKVKIEPVPAAKEAAAAYRKAKGITTPEQTEFARVDPKRAKRIAQAFEEMKHAPNDPTVKRAYKAMIDETKSQWDQIKKTGLKVEFIKPGQADPYAKSPRMAIEDVRKNNHLWVFPTDSGFGSDSKYAKDNPMLEDAGESIGGHPLKNNDVFRIVHDYFGHVQEANGFRADGEENAWRIHAGMYSPLARRAMTTETRGQNSWVNYGPKGEKNRTASGAETVYADQKIGLLPAEFSAFPGDTLKFKHFSKATEDQIDLDPEQMGTGTKGAEAKRNGPKVVSLYAEHGETEPDVSNGRNRFNVEIPKEDLYDGSADPQGLLAQAQVPYGLTQDKDGNMVPVGHRFDMNKFEELVRDAGFLGYHLPEASGILKGQARIFQKYPATREGANLDRAAAAARMKPKAKRADVERLLTEQERARLRGASAKRLVEIFNELPDGAEFAASALAGQAKRGWYRRSAEALTNVFGGDAPRFAALLAALSPKTSVEWNFRNAVATWVGWDKAGRPTDRKAITNVMRENMFPNSNRIGKANILPAWINNTVRALTSEDPSTVTLSGPKVDSFAANLRGETERVTLDAWMANWAGVDQVLFKGEMNKAGDNPGMRPGYLAYAARVREAAEILSNRTGETWTAAEVQETVWSWAKTLYEQAESYGALGTAREILDNKELTDELINATPDFAGLFEDPTVSASLRGTVYGPRAELSAESGRVARAQGKASSTSTQDVGHLRKAADRLDALRQARKDSEAETRAESIEDIAFRTSETPARGIPRADLEQIAERVKKELGVTAQIAETQADLPDYLQALIPEGADGVTGMFYEDPYTGETEIWYVRENLDSKFEAYENALHEAVGHMGLHAVLGKNYHRVMEDIRKSFPAQVRAAAKRNGINMEHADPATRRRLQSLAAEELVAYAAGQLLAKRGATSQMKLWHRIVAKVRDILRGVGLLNGYSSEDIEALIYRARDFFRKPAETRAKEIEYQSKMAAAMKQQPDDAPQWLTPEEYLAGEEITPVNPEQITFSAGFDQIMGGEDDFFGQAEVNAFADGQRIGYMTIDQNDTTDTTWTPIYVFVNPRYRGKGVAQRMYKAISDRLGKKPAPAKVRTPAGRGMWDSFGRRNVAFSMKAPVFYSAVERFVEGTQQNSATPEQWKGQLANAKGVKAEELGWMGINEWLDQQTGAVSKAQVLDFIRANKTELKDVVKGRPAPTVRQLNDGSWMAQANDGGEPFYGATEIEARGRYNDGRVGNTEFAQYQTPGGSNYKELLITLPNEGRAEENEEFATVVSDLANEQDISEDMAGDVVRDIISGQDPTGGISSGLLRRAKALRPTQRDTFRSGHFSEPNVLAHVRFNERTVNGKKVLFIEEVQSDWHQKGRKQGYNANTGDVTAKLNDVKRRIDAMEAPKADAFEAWHAAREAGDETLADERRLEWKRIGDEQADLMGERDNLRAQQINNGVPDAPFKTSWPELAMKRMIRYATENGFDTVAWTSGEMQNERYDLSKQVDRIEVIKFSDKRDTYAITAYKDGQDVIAERDIPRDKIADFIGKEAAQKAEDQLNDPAHVEANGDVAILEGLDLKVGGEGMKGFYDKIFPKTVDKYVKKWGVKVTPMSLTSEKRGGRDQYVARDDGDGPQVIFVSANGDPDEVHSNYDEMAVAEANAERLNGRDLGVPPVRQKHAVHAVPITDAMRDSVQQGQAMFAFKQGPTGNADLDSFISKIGASPKTFRQRWDEFKADIKDRVIMGLFDEFHGIQRAGELAGVTAADSGYMDARLSKNAAELTQTIIEHGPPVWDDGAPNIGPGMSLLSILKPLKGNVNLWLTYITARRADRLMGEGRENLFKANEIAAALDLGRQHPEFDIARAQYNKLQKGVLDFAEQSGVINAQGRALWEHADYIPFHRIVEGGTVKASANGGGGIGFVRNQIVKLTGGKQKIGDPLENIVRNWLSLMDASLKANAGRMTVDGLNGTGLVTPYKGAIPSAPVVPFAAARQFLAQNPALAQTFSAIGLNPASLPPQAFAGLQQMVAQTGPVEDDVISVWRAGRREHWKVHDPMLMRSLQNIHSKAWAPIIKVLTYPKRIVTKGITLTPQFMLKNFWRDVWHVFVQGAVSSGGTKVTVLPTDSLKGLVSALRNDATNRGLLAGGGSFTEGYVNGVDLSGAAKIVRRSLNRGKVRGVLLDNPMKVWRFYRDLQAAAENANRIAMYNKSRAAGLSRKESVFAARDLLDFSMRGNNPIAQLIVMSTPFMNARLQGLYRLGRGFRENFWGVALRGMLITMASAALLARNYDDDRYKELLDEQKANYWHFFDVFQKGDHFQLPKPFEVGAIFGTIPEAIGDAMFTNSEEPDGTLQAAQLVGYTFGNTLNLAPQPQAFWPILELAINKDTFTGSPILTQGDESVLPEDQRGPRTSPTYAALAEAMPDVAPEAMRSPKQLEHLGRGYLGNLQDYVLLVSDAIARKANGETAPPEKATQDIPGLRDFYKTGPARNNRQIIEMYNLANEAAKITASIKRNTDAETDEGDARAEKLDAENAPLLDVADDFKKAAKQVTDLKKEQRQIQLDTTMTPAEKRAEIDEIQIEINDIAKDVYDLRPGGKLNPETAGELLTVPPAARATILRKNNMPATADLLEQLA